MIPTKIWIKLIAIIITFIGIGLQRYYYGMIELPTYELKLLELIAMGITYFLIKDIIKTMFECRLVVK